MTKTINIDFSPEQIDLIIQDLAYLRLIADVELLPKYPHFDGKHYPLGRCKEIRDKVFTLLQECLSKTQKPGLSLIREQIQKGATLRTQWGSLRDEYFQNAIVFENWYIDVSNDTVNPNKPRVEILPLIDANFSIISSFEQFVKVARSYWNVKIYQNNIFPALSPFMPLFYVNRQGRGRIGYASHDCLALAMNSHFFASESVLSTLPQLPEDVVNKWRTILNELPHNDFLHSQGDPLSYCKQYRKEERYLDKEFYDKALSAYFQLQKGT
ncbi:hypothetical protein O1D97_06245 [Marinomonas sp. 15G1-11]|uniref:Uncharacterized protein n=1 Tax=Marinomonas phaeophyticola TaxID=3004091 RepID=A0ABT4JSB6_9GAMM|nr:hypothetical protein [Marinomonas sp. 15G1-11]MCZ2721254.1 hypothetical protein [Marinomonas sp. 15G1-11]